MKRTPIEICHYLLQSCNLHSQWQFKTMIQALCNADLLAFKLLVNATSIKNMPCKVTLQNILAMCKSKHDFVNLQIPVNGACAAFQLDVNKQYPILQANSEADWLQMQHDMQVAAFKQSIEMTVDTEDLHATEEIEQTTQTIEPERGITITEIKDSKQPSKCSKRLASKHKRTK